MTKSVLPAIPVHIAGDLLFFLVVWPQDATRTLVWTRGADAMFWAHAAQAIVFCGLTVLAFRRLRRVTRTPGPRHIRRPAWILDQRGALTLNPGTWLHRLDSARPGGQNVGPPHAGQGGG